MVLVSCCHLPLDMVLSMVYGLKETPVELEEKTAKLLLVVGKNGCIGMSVALTSDRYRKELALPQNNPDLPPPQGRRGQYVMYSQHVQREAYDCASCATHLIHRSAGLG